MPAPTVFISYSHKDEAWKDRLVTHLGVLEHEGLLQTWNDRNIGAGDEWFEEIQKAMDTARVAILLVSANSLTSKFILHQEIPRLLERRTKEGMKFFPVILKSCAWTKLPWLSKFQARPRDGRPLADFRGNGRDAELARIAEEILELASKEPQPITAVPEAVQPVASPLRALHQLPPPPRDFTGRQEDLAFFREKLLKGGTGAIFGLRGMGGLGKTTLALKLAEELTPLYPDAQIYLDLKGVDPQPLTPAQAMAHVIRSFHPEAQLPEDQIQLAAQYRSVLHDKRTILLMDNASPRGSEQVEPLIPPSGSLLLVTSRFRFALPGLSARDLDELSTGDARHLLLTIEPRIGEDADQIARLCCYLPLALRLAGSVLAERPSLSPPDYIRRLSEGKDRFDGVDVCLRASYNFLTEEQRKLWRWLGVFPDTFDLAATVAIWELDQERAQRALEDFTKYSLVDWDQKDGRHWLHDLARQFAIRQLDKGEREAAQGRYASHYLGVLTQAAGLYEKGGELIPEGLKLFDTEWGNIKAGQDWAAKHSTILEGTAALCSDYPNQGTPILEFRLHPNEQIRWRETALKAAQRLGDRGKESSHLNNLGLAYADLGEFRRAVEFYEKDLAIAREIGDRRGEASTLGNMGYAYKNLGETRRAIEFFEQQLAICRETGDRSGEGRALGSLGIAYAILGETRRAIEFYERDLTITREARDRRGEGQILNNLGIAYAALGEPNRAIELYEQCLVIAHDIRDRRGEGQTLGNLGLVYVDLGEPRRAIELYEQQLAIARETGDRRGEATACWNLGVRYKAEGNLSLAVDLMQVCVDYEREISHSASEIHAAYVEALRAHLP